MAIFGYKPLLNMHRHQKLITKHGIVIASLPIGIQESIQAFSELESELEESSNPTEVAELKADIDQADRELQDEIEELIDEELDEELSPLEVKNQIVHALVVASKKKVSEKELKASGYPMEILARYAQEKVGNILLKKIKYESSYQLILK